MSQQTQKIAIEEIAKSIDIPDSAYEKAEKRYQDLGNWFGSEQSGSYIFAPHIYPQGSFRLGTVIRPVNEADQYDLDMGCRMESGISKYSWSQQNLKALVGRDLETYRCMRGIKDKLEEKHRCWCLNYADDLSFHMDVVPSIPEEMVIRKSLSESMVRRGYNTNLAESVASHAGAITDDRHPFYNTVPGEWLISNSQGYALWFESQVLLEPKQLEKSLARAASPQVDELPARKWKSTLQRSVQILKRHRDKMFEKNAEGKPASIIITTLAARAYQGEGDVVAATQNILAQMRSLVGIHAPRIPNPINPNEDFADRWYFDPTKEENFWLWLKKANEDLAGLGAYNDAGYIIEKSMDAFGTRLDRPELQRLMGARVQVAPSKSGATMLTSLPAATPRNTTGPRPLKDNPYA